MEELNMVNISRSPQHDIRCRPTSVKDQRQEHRDRAGDGKGPLSMPWRG